MLLLFLLGFFPGVLFSSASSEDNLPKCCQCNSVCSNPNFGVLMFKPRSLCNYTIPTTSRLQTRFYKISSTQGDQITLYYPTAMAKMESWRAPDSSAVGPAVESFGNNEFVVIEITKGNLDAEFVVEYYSDKNLQKNEDFLLKSCEATSYGKIYGSINITNPQYDNFFLMQLTDHQSTLYSEYEQGVKSYFDELFAQSTSLSGYHNLMVFSFSPGLFVNFALEIIDDINFGAESFRKLLTSGVKKPTAGSNFIVDAASLQLNSEEECFEITFTEDEYFDLSETTFSSAISFAVSDYCKFLRICSADQNVETSRYASAEYAIEELKFKFCFNSLLVSRQIIEAVLNERFQIASQLGSFEFDYKVITDSENQVIIQEKDEKFTFLDLIWVSIIVILIILMICVIFVAVWYYCQYKHAQKHFNMLSQEDDELAMKPPEQVELRKNSNKMHQDAVRASGISFVLKTGPRQTFLRPESQISMGPNDLPPHKSMPDLTYEPHHSTGTNNFQKRPAGHVYTRGKPSGKNENTPSSNQSSSLYSRTPSDTNRAPTDRYAPFKIVLSMKYWVNINQQEFSNR